MSNSYIIGASRTAVGRYLGGLSALPAPELATYSLRSTLDRGGLEASAVEEVVLGVVLSAGLGQAPARQAALRAGCSPQVGALTINKVCGSGLKAVMLADQAIRLGDQSIILAGGMESMSNAPFLMPGARKGWKYGHQLSLDHLLHDGLWCPSENCAMGDLAEYISQKCSISREAQDEFAAESHRRAAAAIEEGAFFEEIAPVAISTRGKEKIITVDEGVREETTLESLSALKGAFQKEGTVTAGNASQLSDGAASLLVVSEEIALDSNAKLKAKIIASATSGVEPKDIFIAPVSAMEKVLSKANLSVDDIDLFELNEAFAAQALACMAPLNIPEEKTNVHGGAIALGHPLGASGARVLVTLLYALKRRGLKRGLASLCLGGGNAVAIIVELV
ncbi:MAG: thiolase family protein [Pirellulaceae bacterium]|nr:thiolase family protein [Pirellulaceae bacterium]